MAHGIVDRQASGDRASRRADIHVDLTFAILRGQEEQLGYNQPGHALLDRAVDHNDTLAQEARKNVVGAFTAPGGFDDGWYNQTRCHSFSSLSKSIECMACRLQGITCPPGRVPDRRPRREPIDRARGRPYIFWRTK